MNNIFKIKNGYCHIFDDRLVVSKSTKGDDLVRNYRESINNIFKTLIVLFVFLSVFSLLAVVFYNIGKKSLTIYAGSFALIWLILTFYIMFYTSASPLIKKECIVKIKIKKILFSQVGVLIIFKELGQKKRRFLMIEKNQVDSVKNILLSQKLIEVKDTDLKSRGIDIVAIAITIIAFTFPFTGW